MNLQAAALAPPTTAAEICVDGRCWGSGRNEAGSFGDRDPKTMTHFAVATLM